jgi:hypothetical protein
MLWALRRIDRAGWKQCCRNERKRPSRSVIEIPRPAASFKKFCPGPFSIDSEIFATGERPSDRRAAVENNHVPVEAGRNAVRKRVP